MSTLIVDWAILGKHPGSHEEYGVIDCSDPTMFGNFGEIMRRFTSGTSDKTSLPRTSTSYFRDNDRREMVGMSYQDWSGPLDAYGRRSARTRFVCAPWAEIVAHGVSYRKLGAALRDFDPQKIAWTDDRRGRLEIGPYPADEFCLETTPLARTAAGLLLSQRTVCIVGSARELTHDVRLGFLDAVAALLPYGFRSSLAISTWTKTNSPHNMRLSFASVAPDWAAHLVWDEPALDPEILGNGIAAEYLSMLDGFDDAMRAEIICQLGKVEKPLSFRREEELGTAVDELTAAVKAANAVRREQGGQTAIDLVKPPRTRPALPLPNDLPAIDEAVTPDPDSPDAPLPTPSVPEDAGPSVRELVEAGVRAIKAGDTGDMTELTGLLVNHTVLDALERDDCREAIRAGALPLVQGHTWPEQQRVLVVAILLAVYAHPLQAADIPYIRADFDKSFGPLWTGILPAPREFMTDAAKIVLAYLRSQREPLLTKPSGLELYKVLKALAEEPSDQMFEAVLRDVKAAGTTPQEFRSGLEQHGYFSTQPLSQRHTRDLLDASHVDPLDMESISTIFRHVAKPSLYLLHAIVDKADRKIGSDALLPLMVPPIDAAKLPFSDREILERQIVRRDKPLHLPRGRLLPYAGWAVAGIMTVIVVLLLVHTLGGNSAPQTTSLPASPGTTEPSIPASLAPVPFGWPDYRNDAHQGGKTKDSVISHWAESMSPTKCVALMELNQLDDLQDIYTSLSLACQAATADNSDAIWKQSHDVLAAFEAKLANSVRLQSDIQGGCLDKLALKMAESLLKIHAGDDNTGRGHPVTITQGPRQEIDCHT
jgi:hypothetical protein